LIRLGRLFPEHLNLNGDFGNLEVIGRQLAWRGLAYEIVDITATKHFAEDVDFVLIGHGSEAAWKDISENCIAIRDNLQALKAQGVSMLAVSTGFEKAIEMGLIVDLVVGRIGERVSKFVVHPDGNSQILGYVNVDNDLPVIHRSGSVIGTTLHGPVLAKNPALLNEILTAISSRANVLLPELLDAKKADQLADLVAEVWKLESDLASE
jgi:CobQ-like glutamine amidotransferase family enzyme